jgi:hypothetical protein
MGRQTGCWNHKMELTTFKHHFILIDSKNLSASKDPFVRNVLRPTPNPSLYGGELLSFSFLIGYAYIPLPREGRGGGYKTFRTRKSLEVVGDVGR